MYCDECVKAAERLLPDKDKDKTLVKITEKPGSFKFTVESAGQFKAHQILLKAMDVLDSNLDSLRMMVKNTGQPSGQM